MSWPFLTPRFDHPENVYCWGRAIILPLLPYKDWMHWSTFICFTSKIDPSALIHFVWGSSGVCRRGGPVVLRFTCNSLQLAWVSLTSPAVSAACDEFLVFSLLEWIPVAIQQAESVRFSPRVQDRNISSISIMNRSRNSDLDTGRTAEESRSIPRRGNWFFPSEHRPGRRIVKLTTHIQCRSLDRPQLHLHSPIRPYWVVRI